MFFNKEKVTTLSPADAKAIMDSRKVTLIDVRTANEFRAGHIKKAIHVNFNEVTSRIESVAPNKDQEILIYCTAGVRSKKAVRMLLKMGYTNVVDIGGFSAWPYK